MTTSMGLNFKKLYRSATRPDLGNPSMSITHRGTSVLGELSLGHMFCSE